MGVELKTVSLKWDDETLEAAAELQEMFSPFVEGRSQLSRVVFKMFLKIIRTQGMLEVVVATLQGLQRNTSSHQLPIQFPSLPSPRLVEGQAGSVTGPRLNTSSRRTAASVRVLGMVAWSVPPLMRGSLTCAM